MKTKPTTPPVLWPGETNVLRALAGAYAHLGFLIREEVERLEKLRSNPTFPVDHYREHFQRITTASVTTSEALKEVKL